MHLVLQFILLLIAEVSLVKRGNKAELCQITKELD